MADTNEGKAGAAAMGSEAKCDGSIPPQGCARLTGDGEHMRRRHGVEIEDHSVDWVESLHCRVSDETTTFNLKNGEGGTRVKSQAFIAQLLEYCIGQSQTRGRYGAPAPDIKTAVGKMHAARTRIRTHVYCRSPSWRGEGGTSE